MVTVTCKVLRGGVAVVGGVSRPVSGQTFSDQVELRAVDIAVIHLGREIFCAELLESAYASVLMHGGTCWIIDRITIKKARTRLQGTRIAWRVEKG